VYTIVEGATASAGTLMSVVGKRRFIRPHASMLIHELSSWFGGKMTNIDDEYQNLKQMMDDIKSIYLENTSLAKEEMEVRTGPFHGFTSLVSIDNFEQLISIQD
jgi:ATP-dependent protease ClpP protease subunit